MCLLACTLCNLSPPLPPHPYCLFSLHLVNVSSLFLTPPPPFSHSLCFDCMPSKCVSPPSLSLSLSLSLALSLSLSLSPSGLCVYRHPWFPCVCFHQTQQQKMNTGDNVISALFSLLPLPAAELSQICVRVCVYVCPGRGENFTVSLRRKGPISGLPPQLSPPCPSSH